MKVLFLLLALFLSSAALTAACGGNDQAAATPTPTQAARTPPPITASGQSTDRAGCDPSYPDACLKDGIGDYDCAGGTGNGPNYVKGPIRVLPPDPFRLDSDHNGWGCESH